MKIFDLQPITITEYIFNEQHLADSYNSQSGSYGFDFQCMVVDSQKKMIITFEILHSIGDVEYEEEIFLTDDPNELLIVGSSTVGESAEEVLMSYKSSCQFNLENEGYDADVVSLTELLTEYYAHTQKFLDEYGFKSLRLQREALLPHDIESSARCAIENLKGNNMYEF